MAFSFAGDKGPGRIMLTTTNIGNIPLPARPVKLLPFFARAPAFTFLNLPYADVSKSKNFTTEYPEFHGGEKDLLAKTPCSSVRLRDFSSETPPWLD
jgi:hypothetical protein